MTTTTSRRRLYSLPLSDCISLGTSYAAAGWSKERVLARLAESGYRPEGQTARRMMRAYDKQIARG